MTQKPAIGFIGVGQMGEGMCRRLLAAGYPLSVMAHRNRAPVDRLVAEGAREARDAAALAAACNIVILCVSNADVVERTVEAMRPALTQGKIIIDTSTGDPAAMEAIGSALAQKGVSYLDATISGSSAQVLEGQVLVMAGGEAAAFDACADLFATFARDRVLAGPVGSGARMKLVTNLDRGAIEARIVEVRFSDALICPAGQLD